MVTIISSWLAGNRVLINYLLICGSAGALPLLSIPSHAIIAGGDATSPELAPAIALIHLHSAWYPAGGLGQQAAFQWPLLFPFVPVDLGLAKLGASYVAINHMWFVLLFALQAGFTYWLYREMFPEYANSAAAFFAPVANILNPFTVIIYHSPYPTTNLAIAILPGMLAAVLKIARAQSASSFIIFFVLCAISTTGDVNFAITFVEGVAMLAAWTYLFFSRRGSIAFATAFVFLGCHSVLGFAHLHAVQSSITTVLADSITYSRDTMTTVSHFSTFDTSWRLIGGYLFFNDVAGKPFIAQRALYISNPLFIAATWVLPFLALGGAVAIVRPTLRKRLLFLLPVLIIGLFMVKGTSGEGGDVIGWLFDHFTLFYAFRDPFAKFAWLLALLYALMGALGLAVIISVIRSKAWAAAAFSVAILASALSGLPILSGHLFWTQAIVRIPPAYFRIAAILNNEPNSFRIAQMPVAPYGFDAYRWGYVGAGLNSNLVRRPLLSREFDFDAPGNVAINSALQHANVILGDDQVAALLGFYGFGYVLSDTSFLPAYYGPGFSSQLLHLPSAGIYVQARDGDVTLARIQPDLINPSVYVAARGISGAHTIPDVSAACFLIVRCARVAFVPDTIAKVFSGDVDHLSYPPATAPKTPLNAVYAFRRDPFVASSIPSSMNAQTMELSFFDFANLTLSAPHIDPSAHPFVLPRRSVSHLRVELSGPPTSGMLMSEASIPHYLRSNGQFATLCGARKDVDTIQTPDNADTSQPFFLGIRYIAPAGNIYLVISDTGPKRQAVYNLPSAEHLSSFARLLELTHTSHVAIVMASTPRPSCARVQLVLAQGALPSNATLFEQAATFNATPPYYSDHATYYLPAWQNHPQGSVPISEPAVSILWSAPEAVDPMPANRSGMFISVRQNPLSTLLHFEATNANADVHATMLHLVPGAAYRISFRLRTTSDARLILAALTAGGTTLRRMQTGPASTPQTIQMQFRVPENASDCVVYYYFGDLSGHRQVVELSEPIISRVSPPGTVALLLRGRFPQPTRTQVTKIDATSWRVHVTDAPDRFVVVLNSSYHTDWQLVGAPSTHFVANLFENGWVVNQPGTYDLTVRFEGRRYINWGIIVGSALIALGLLIFLSRQYFRRSAALGSRRGNVGD